MRRDFTFPIRLLFLGLAVGLFAACGGGGGGGGPAAPATPPGGLESFSPFTVPDTGGAPKALTWSYVVNDGQTLSVDTQGIAADLTFDDPLTISWDPVRSERTTHLPFGFSGTVPNVPGTVTGSGSVRLVEEIAVNGGVTQVMSATSTFTVNGLATLIPWSASASAVIAFDTPLDWFPDREDLDTLGAGFVHAPLADVAGTISGQAQASVAGVSQSLPPFTRDVTAPQRWEIVEKLPSFVMQAKTFDDVVVVDLTTTIPDLQNPGSGQDAPGSMRGWFVKGVGMIKATGVLQRSPSPIDIELISTNFE